MDDGGEDIERNDLMQSNGQTGSILSCLGHLFSLHSVSSVGTLELDNNNNKHKYNQLTCCLAITKLELYKNFRGNYILCSVN